MMPKYFTPQDATGIQRFTQGGTAAGWYQFNRVGMLVSPLPGITIPQGATGLLIQAVSSLQYCQSPTDALVPTTAYMTLAAGDYMFLPGQQAVEQFCVLLPASGAAFTVQFLFGDIGPAPWIKQHSTGGVIPPPIPGTGAVFTINTIHVMKADGLYGGNDATGTRQRLDLPYLTITAALAAMQAGDKLVVWPGTYTEDVDIAQDVTIELIGADIVGFVGVDGGVTATIEGAGCSIVNAGAAENTVALAAGATLNLRVWRVVATGSGGVGLYCNGSVLNSTCNVIAPEGIALYAADGTTVHAGDLYTDSDAALYVNGGTVTVTGNVRSDSDRGALCVAGSITINGTVTAGTVGIEVNIGTFIMNGNVTADTIGARVNGVSVMRVLGNISCTARGAFVSTGLFYMNGNIEAETERALFVDSGTAYIYGSLLSTDSWGCFINGTGSVQLHGFVYSDLDSPVSIESNTIIVELFGGCYLQSGGGAPCIADPLVVNPSVRSYGASGNVAKDATVTVVGTLNIVP